MPALVLSILSALLAGAATTKSTPPAFVGSRRCGSCHARQYELWSKDWHSRAMSPATPESVVARFDPPVRIEKGPTRAETVRRDGHFAMKAAGRDGAMDEWPVVWAIGGRRMQDFLTLFGGGRLQVLPIYWHVTGGGEWVDYTSVKQGDLDPEHPFYWTNYARTFNKECLACHVTGGAIGWNEAKSAFESTWSEAGVACEDCHGPGARHARSGSPAAIVRPTSLPKERAAAVCASCHSPRAPWRSAFSPSARFRPGQRLDDVFEPLTPAMGPGELSGDFWLDGRPSVGSMESAALEQSAC
ncbi:MAG TPA: multiheme c-type cytochrome, partial [Thermoanaerobaculia bacterium]|nr:multiheme c-type cytochrome [Thermoanaerobaculia bacterium]